MKTTAAPIAIAAIVVAVIFAGCITLLPSPDTSPSGVVETFASWHGDENFEACYFLMSRI